MTITDILTGVFVAGFVTGSILSYVTVRKWSKEFREAVDDIWELRKWSRDAVAEARSLAVSYKMMDNNVKYIREYLEEIGRRAEDISANLSAIYDLLEDKFRWTVSVHVGAKKRR